jgi:hypothetical protein
MHIGQLETILKRKDDEVDHLRQANTKILSSNKSFSGGLFTSNDNVFKHQNYENRSSDEFHKNEENENHLKKLMSNYSSDRSEAKQPGKIYSIRKK